jgi:hypothetical protein
LPDSDELRYFEQIYRKTPLKSFVNLKAVPLPFGAKRCEKIAEFCFKDVSIGKYVQPV